MPGVRVDDIGVDALDVESVPVGDCTLERGMAPEGGKAAIPVKSSLNRTWLPDFILALVSASLPTRNLTTDGAGDPSFIVCRSINIFSDGVLDEESIPVNEGEETLDSNPATAAAVLEPALLSSSSENVPEERRPALHGGLTESAEAQVLTDRRFDFERSEVKLCNARCSLRAWCETGL